MKKKKYKIINENGVHARPATSLVNTCMTFACEIYLSVGKKEVDFKSIMGVMSLGIYSGTVVEVTCDGLDEAEALNAINAKMHELNLGKEL